MENTNSPRPAPRLALVVAVAANGVIGRDNRLPWHHPEDLAWFKQVTMGKAMIMGRRTWDSIGQPLPGRDSIVLTHDAGWRAEGAHAVHSLDEALDLARRLRPDCAEIAVIGGAQVFAQALPLAERIYWTDIRADHRGDTRFPPFDRGLWRESARDDRPDLSFVILDRK